MRVLIRVSYDGTSYHGWQIQPGVITVEEVLNRTLSELFSEDIKVIGASRTDTGVHSMGTVAVFDTTTRMPAEKIMYALNQRLPDDIRICESKQCPDDFHPRRCNSKKTYIYRIYSADIENPMYRLYYHQTRYRFDVDKMQEAAGYLIGEHDFKSFCSTHTSAETTIRTLYEVEVKKEILEADQKEQKVQKEHDASASNLFGQQPCVVTIKVSGNGFLYNMVRIIAGTLMEVGIGRLAPEKVKEMLAAKDRIVAGPTAPACGLTLLSYELEE